MTYNLQFRTKNSAIANWLISPDNPANLPLKEAEVKIRELGLEKIYQEIELPLVEVLDYMHKTGIAVDVKRLNKLRESHEKQLIALEQKIYKQAGEKFNINSPRQLSQILFEKLKIKSRSVTKTGLRSTKAEQLEILKSVHPIIGLILRYRELFKIKSTYLDAFAKLGKRVYTTFAQTGTATGRLASRNPNLQNIPPAVKQVFIADKGYQLVSFDYSQLELRILAAVSGDAKMISAFKRGLDIHKLTASQVFNVSADKVTPTMRQIAKTLNFGVAYGMGANAFAKVSGLSRKEAEQFIKEYYSDFRQIKEWQEKVKQDVRKKEYAENLNGRKRWLPAINSLNQRLAAEAERAAINMPIQSLEADIIKTTMIEIFQKFKKSNDAKLLLSIHDELLFEIKSDKLKERILEIKKAMEGVYNLSVSLQVEVKYGKNWRDLKLI